VCTPPFSHGLLRIAHFSTARVGSLPPGPDEARCRWRAAGLGASGNDIGALIGNRGNLRIGPAVEGIQVENRLTRRLGAGVPLDRRHVLLGLAAVGGFLAVDFGAILYAGGWLDGERLTPRGFMDAFKRVYGSHPGFRRNHAKGVAVAGYFDSNGAGQEISKAAVFRPGHTPVVGRFSLAGGNPTVADMIDTPRGLGLVFGYPGGQQWRTAMLNSPVFLDNSPQGFYDRLLASKISPATGKPDPQAMAHFLTVHPETARAMAVIKAHPPTSGFGDSTFGGLNAFYFVNESGARTAVRWWLAPIGQVLPPLPRSSGPNALFDNLIRQIESRPLQWKLLVTLGAPTDPVNDATVAWPAERRVIEAGTLTLTSIETERAGNARDINFDPLVLPDGIEPSDDPLLSARSAVYAASYRLRAGEPKSASAVNVGAVAL
jgi:catalase